MQTEPRRPEEPERDAFYRQYDAAIELLPREVRRLVNLTTTGVQNGVMTFCGVECQELASVDLRTKEVHVGKQTDRKSVQPRKPTQAASQPGVSKAYVMATMKALAEGMAEEHVKLLTRVASLEKALMEASESGFRYRGFYRDGMNAKRGEAFTHDGSLWRACRDTDDKPCSESADWQLAVRKGRDAR